MAAIGCLFSEPTETTRATRERAMAVLMVAPAAVRRQLVNMASGQWTRVGKSNDESMGNGLFASKRIEGPELIAAIICSGTVGADAPVPEGEYHMRGLISCMNACVPAFNGNFANDGGIDSSALVYGDARAPVAQLADYEDAAQHNNTEFCVLFMDEPAKMAIYGVRGLPGASIDEGEEIFVTYGLHFWTAAFANNNVPGLRPAQLLHYQRLFASAGPELCRALDFIGVFAPHVVAKNFNLPHISNYVRSLGIYRLSVRVGFDADTTFLTLRGHDTDISALATPAAYSASVEKILARFVHIVATRCPVPEERTLHVASIMYCIGAWIKLYLTICAAATSDGERAECAAEFRSCFDPPLRMMLSTKDLDAIHARLVALVRDPPIAAELCAREVHQITATVLLSAGLEWL